MKKRQNLTTGVLLIAAILVIINVLSYSYFVRLDFTRDKRYTLSHATLDLLKNLKEPVTVTAYFSEDLPPAISQVRSDFKDLLVEYAARSGNKVVFNFINPNKNDTLEKEALKNGIEPIMVNIREKDEMKKQKAYLGAVVKMGDKTDIIPFIQPGGAMEYTLSTSIKKISIVKKPPVGFLQGNGEPTLPEMQQVSQDLSILYDVEPLPLADTAPIPSVYKTLIMVDPKDTFKTGQLKQLDGFLAKGGRLFIAYSGLSSNLQTASGKAMNIGLRPWLASKKIELEPKFIIDSHCGNINVQQNFNGMPMYQQIPFPYLPMISNFANHPITQGLSSVMLPFAADIKFTGDTNKEKYTVLAKTSNQTGLLSTPLFFDYQHQWKESELPLSNLTVAAAVSGIDGNKDARIVLVSCGGFATNGSGRQAMKQQDDNIDLVANSVDWLSDDTGLIELRSKMITSVPLKDISDSEKTLLKYLNFLLPLLFVVIYGAVRMQIKRKVRLKRMEETYA